MGEAASNRLAKELLVPLFSAHQVEKTAMGWINLRVSCPKVIVVIRLPPPRRRGATTLLLENSLLHASVRKPWSRFRVMLNKDVLTSREHILQK